MALTGSPRFHKILLELGALHDRKQADYGTDADPFANVRGSSDWGIPPWVGAMVRATDKLRRLQKFARKGELANESVQDSFRDLAVYAIIGLILYEETAEPEHEDEPPPCDHVYSDGPDAGWIGCIREQGHQGAHRWDWAVPDA